MPEFSVLIPVYNAAPYLERSVGSVLNQTVQDFELILIDDGSTDDSWAVIKSLAERDPRIRIQQNEANSGTFVTRGRLVRESVGTYVTFVDADDEIAPTFLEEAKKLLQNKKFDVIEFGLKSENANCFTQSLHLKPGKWILHGHGVFEEYFTHPSYCPTVWGRVYRGDWLRSQEFPDIRLTNLEDYVFLTMLLYRAKSYCFRKKPLYIYHFGNGCCCRDHYTLENYKTICLSTQNAITLMDDFFKINPVSKKAESCYQKFKTGAFYSLLNFILQNKVDDNQKKEAFEVLLKNNGSQEILKILQNSLLLNEYTPISSAAKGFFAFALKVVVRWRKRITGLLK